jgi:hypothetical protein
MKQPPEWSPRINPARKIAFSGNFYSRSHDAVIRVYDEACTVIETHDHTSRLLNLALSGLLISMCRQPKSGAPTKPDNTQTGLVEIRQVDLVFLPHPRFSDERLLRRQ